MDLIHYRIATEKTVERTQVYKLPTEYGEFVVYCYRDLYKEGNQTHLALVRGDIRRDEPVLARVLVTDTIRDLLGVANPNRPSWSLHQSLARIAQEGKGVVVLLANDKGTGDVLEQLARFHAQHDGAAPAPHGSYLTVGTGSQILRDVGVGKMRLLSYPTKYAISGFDLEVVEYIPCEL
jgi:3,4-dihydroxy 2-butanone 4-phosphate synthase/GTP cyclohydrolase II